MAIGSDEEGDERAAVGTHRGAPPRPVIPGLRGPGGRLAVTVDGSRCTGWGICVGLAGAGFALDRFGYAYALPGAGQLAADDPLLRAALRDAETRCPERAIRVEVVHDSVPPPLTFPAAAAAAGGAAPPRGEPPRRLSRPDEQGVESLDEWVGEGGFAALDRERLLADIDRTGLAGHGGGGFPVAAKWRTVRGVQPPVVVANGAEREPGSVKDRYLMERRPSLVLDGLRAAATAVGARLAYVGVDQEAGGALAAMTAAAEAAAARGLLGPLEVRVVPVPPRYVAGEETALISFLAGHPALPRTKPPYPSQSGVLGKPTLVHNVETLAQVALTAAFGADWFCGVGGPESFGTGLFSVGRLGGTAEVVEQVAGVSVRQLLGSAGLPDAFAVLLGGWSGTLLPDSQFDLALDFRSVARTGGALGTKSLQVLADGDCPVAVVADILGLLAQETAGQCPPCVQGLPYLAAVLTSLVQGTPDVDQLAEAKGFAATLVGRGTCRLPDGAARLLRSLLDNFPAEVEGHLQAGGCAAHS